jgi:hypothetical protein
VSGHHVRAGERNSKVAGDDLRLIDFLPLSEVHTDRVDVDDQCERMLISVAVRQGRLADARRTIDQQQHGVDRTCERVEVPIRQICRRARLPQVAGVGVALPIVMVMPVTRMNRAKVVTPKMPSPEAPDPSVENIVMMLPTTASNAIHIV